jgi:hypothetical protein
MPNLQIRAYATILSDLVSPEILARADAHQPLAQNAKSWMSPCTFLMLTSREKLTQYLK